MKCRHCGAELAHTLVDLGCPPPSNAYISGDALHEPERCYPLKVLVCGECWLVQTEDFVGAEELFSDSYAYFSSYSTSWLEHARAFVRNVVSRFQLGSASGVVEIGANDGYLLQYVREFGIPCYGVEPTRGTAQVARARGIDIVEDFFGLGLAGKLARNGRQADLIVANNVLAHVPEINDFVRGAALLLQPSGVATFEFPHVMNLVEQNQFDTIYHEHYSYLSLIAVLNIFSSNGLRVFDVEELPTHGGSLRVYASKAESRTWPISEAVSMLREREIRAGVDSFGFYTDFQNRADGIKSAFLSFLREARDQGKLVAAYGAAAKGNTLLNYSGVNSELIFCIADRNPWKQGKYLPGSRIPIMSDEQLIVSEPDFVVILPWNLKHEVMRQLEHIRKWGGRFVTAVPKLEIS